jgi:hypothetical protein
MLTNKECDWPISARQEGVQQWDWLRHITPRPLLLKDVLENMAKSMGLATRQRCVVCVGRHLLFPFASFLPEWDEGF